MPNYNYRVRSKEGELLTGTTEADNKNEVISKLDKQGYSIIELSSNSSGGFRESFLDQFRKVKRKDVIFFSRQLSTLLRSGTSLLPSLKSIQGQASNKKFKAILDNVVNSVHSGTSLSESLAKYPHVFSELFVSMVRVGETGGILDKVLDRLAELGMQEMEMNSRIKSALVYPVVLVIVAFLVVNLLIVGVLPKFVSVFEASGAKLPMITQIILNLSRVIREYWFYIFAGIVVLFWWFKVYIGSKEGKYNFHKNLLKIPVFGKIYTTLQVARFTRVLSALTSVGIPLLEALGVVRKTVTNVVIRKSIEDIRKHLAAGESLVEPFKNSPYFSPLVTQMISTGEKTGKLDQMLDEIASFYEPEVEHTIKNFASLLEPIMLLVMGAMVAIIALSVLLPIFNLIKVFR
ncbi:MAG: type II secretion system F family protein [Candidatus Omnitrophica bacterium]|nr:type II secretion system F family protein [Candidatus Omnitrophota bacterium]MCF7888219.1 type II secretion system F family protein [Candidatus Omnitrophota bacterium]